MKVSIKLDKAKRYENEKGHPVIIYITANYGEKKIRSDYRAKINEWNERLLRPTKKHPDYFNLFRYVEELKTKIGKIQLEPTRKSLTIDDAVAVLFRKSWYRSYWHFRSTKRF